MGNQSSNSNYFKTLKIKPNTFITKGQFDKICSQYSRTYMTVEDATSLLGDLSDAMGLERDKQLIEEIIELANEDHSDCITARTFEDIFFHFAKVNNVGLSNSLIMERGARGTLVASTQEPAPVAPARGKTEPGTGEGGAEKVLVGVKTAVTTSGELSPSPVAPPVAPVSPSPPPVAPGPPPPPPVAPGPPPPPGGGRQKAWITLQVKTKIPDWIFTPATSTPMPLDTESLEWAQALGFERSSEGSTGVFFLGFPNNRVVVLKGSATPLSDYFASELGNLAGIPTTRMRMIPMGSEFKEIFCVLNRLDKEKPERKQKSHSKMSQIPILTVMEFLKGSDFSHSDFHTLLKPDTDLATKNCFLIGRMIMLDVLINNWDRLPVIWDSNQANVDNIYFSTDPERPVIAIDQTVTSIKNPELYDKYMGRVQNLVNEIANFNGSKPELTPTINNIRQIFLKHDDVKFDIGLKGLRNVWIGMMSGLVDITQNITDERLQVLYDEAERFAKTSIGILVSGTADPNGYGLGQIELKFLVDVLEEMKKKADFIRRRFASLNIRVDLKGT
eukprot:TRINITY_DN9634_c0_g1_i1.p1 TRINITY_DN9634_c0_g1~~TRINITY_DN9634_c0_g1_i1.p1  ORF type:complete len:559 (-),score=118.49 TRINITY_DN9634_c0_g1_i1:96-1772(-)